jgi:hypothetical protein
MGQQAIVARTGLDEEREVNKRVLNTASWNERLNTLELNWTEYVCVVCVSVCVCPSVCDACPIKLRQPTHELTNPH